MNDEPPVCCGAASPGGRSSSQATEVSRSTTQVHHDQVEISGGVFAMGNPFPDGFWGDGEGPVHEVELSPYAIDVTAVTNAQYAAFVDATGYVTEAEGFGDSVVFHLLVEADEADRIGYAGGAPWWIQVRGASWRHPYGPRSEAEPDHPVTQVSWRDAQAYCTWSGRSLPTEAEWEHAARGGFPGRRFPWGDQLEEGGVHHANVWQGDFPVRNSEADGFVGTAPVRTYEPNGYGLYQTVGNVWEWCADWFSPETYRRDLTTGRVSDPTGPERGEQRVIRGGSYLCHHSYCTRYRVAARSANTPESASGNMGFRTVSRST